MSLILSITLTYNVNVKANLTVYDPKNFQDEDVICLIKRIKNEMYSGNVYSYFPVDKSEIYKLRDSKYNWKKILGSTNVNYPPTTQEKKELKFCDFKIYKSKNYDSYFSLKKQWENTGGFAGPYLISDKVLSHFLDEKLYVSIIKDSNNEIVKEEENQTQIIKTPESQTQNEKEYWNAEIKLPVRSEKFIVLKRPTKGEAKNLVMDKCFKWIRESGEASVAFYQTCAMNTKIYKYNNKIVKKETRKIKKTELAQTQKKVFTNKLIKVDEFKYDQSRKFDPLYNIELLGRYDSSFENSKNFPKEMIEFWGGNEKCLKFYCRQQKSSKEMSKRFKRNKKYNNKYPGSIFYAMAHFEYYYQFKLSKGEKSISKTLAKFEGKKSLNSGYTVVKSLIGLNKIRKKLRNALGMDLKTDPVVAINKFWTMGNFMAQAEVKQNELNEEIIKRKKLIDKYKSLTEKLRKKAEKNLEKEMFKKIKKGKV